jgi:hypothetical protein
MFDSNAFVKLNCQIPETPEKYFAQVIEKRPEAKMYKVKVEFWVKESDLREDEEALEIERKFGKH